MLSSFKNLREFFRSPLVWFGLLAALLYSSWPLGFWLDRPVAYHSLASELEAPHRPYNWLFISMDVLTGLVLAGIGIWQARKRPVQVPGIIIWSYVLFGLLVAVAALTPLVCDPTTQSCGPLIHNYRLLVHGIASISSVFFLLAALIGVTHRAHKHHKTSYVAIGLSVLLVGWLVFGVGSLLQILLHTHSGNSMQDFFISLCSLTIIAVVANVEWHRLAPLRDEEV
jgi:uncharacterized membrane protein